MDSNRKYVILNGLPCEGNRKKGKILESLRGVQGFILKGTNGYYREKIEQRNQRLIRRYHM